MQIRRASFLDCSPMAALLNEIIHAGGTTAYTDPVESKFLKERIASDPGQSVWHVAEKDGDVLGFQFIRPNPTLPPEACDIATFVKIGATGLGIGSKLFAATEAAALKLGYVWINANIRADNESGLTYYQSRGFRVYDVQENVTLSSGLIVDKVLKRFDL